MNRHDAEATLLSYVQQYANRHNRKTGGLYKLGDVYDDCVDLRAAILMLVPEFEYPDWSHKTVGQLWAYTQKPRRLTVPAHCMDEDFFRELDTLGVKVVCLKDAPWAVTFEGTAAALREMYETLWGDPDPFPGFDEEKA